MNMNPYFIKNVAMYGIAGYLIFGTKGCLVAILGYLIFVTVVGFFQRS